LRGGADTDFGHVHAVQGPESFFEFLLAFLVMMRVRQVMMDNGTRLDLILASLWDEQEREQNQDALGH